MSNEVDKELINLIIRKIFDFTGMVYTEKDRFRIIPRLNILMKELNVSDHEALLHALKASPPENIKGLVINIFTNNESFFFRDSKQIDSLIKVIIKERAKANDDDLHIWSSSCSTGQEPYSILMGIDSNLGPAIFHKTKIHASDISTSSLELARQGEYNPLEIQRGLPSTMLLKYFNQVDDGEKWQISSKIRDKVDFFEFNLLDGEYRKEYYDVILCRNTLIYQNKDNKIKILENIYSSLKAGGYFLLGTGETLNNVFSGLTQEIINSSAYYRKD